MENGRRTEIQNDGIDDGREAWKGSRRLRKGSRGVEIGVETLGQRLRKQALVKKLLNIGGAGESIRKNLQTSPPLKIRPHIYLSMCPIRVFKRRVVLNMYYENNDFYSFLISATFTAFFTFYIPIK